jgi:hypothetical protein
MSSDDPEYPNTLAGVLSDAGRPQEAERWRVRAASRYQELVSRHPDAFAHHVTVVHADQRTKRPRRAQPASPCPEATIRQEQIMLAFQHVLPRSAVDAAPRTRLEASGKYLHNNTLQREIVLVL